MSHEFYDGLRRNVLESLDLRAKKYVQDVAVIYFFLYILTTFLTGLFEAERIVRGKDLGCSPRANLKNDTSLFYMTPSADMEGNLDCSFKNSTVLFVPGIPGQM
jgi:hypothetical protein